MSIYEWASKGESWYGINSPSWLRLMSSILLPLTWKKTDLQILCFPFMGNFTSSSWGLVQMKTNGEADSSQVSGNCRGREDQQRKDQFSIILHRHSPAILHTECVKPHDAQYHCDETFRERLCLYSRRDVPNARCNTTCLTATQRVSLGVLPQNYMTNDAAANDVPFHHLRAVKMRVNI